MRYNKLYLAVALMTCLAGSMVALAGTVSAQYADDMGGMMEKRPFDFADKFYGNNGVDSSQIISRRTGMDKYSVFDYIDSEIFRGVRILETNTGYDQNGIPVYWIFYGDLDKSSFTSDIAGEIALTNATRTAIFRFPSTRFKGEQRQASVLDNRNSHREKNPLGLRMAVDVEFTGKAYTKEGQKILNQIVGKNGASLDGLPIIRTVAEIEQLTRYEMVTQRARSISQPGMPLFTMALIIEDPRQGAIAPDAFLEYPQIHGKPLESEQMFFEDFECLQKSGKFCKER